MGQVMDLTNKQRTARNLVPTLAELLGVSASAIEIRMKDQDLGRADLMFQIGETLLLVEYKSSASLSAIAAAAESLRAYAASHSGSSVVPLVVIPFLGPAGRKYCQEVGVNCIDMSGNAEVSAPGLRLMVEGRPNRLKRSGMDVSVFAPRSSRIARELLLHPSSALSQRELSVRTGLDEGFVSRIVRRLESDDLIVRDAEGRVRPRDPVLLLDSWREAYRFRGYEVIKGHVPAPSAQALMLSAARVFEEEHVDYAMTGLCAAWLYTHFASFRTVAIYVSDRSAESCIAPLGFHEVERGANTWLLVPKELSVFEGVERHEGVRCASVVQTYLDLKDAGERSNEASETLKQLFVSRIKDGQQTQS